MINNNCHFENTFVNFLDIHIMFKNLCQVEYILKLQILFQMYYVEHKLSANVIKYLVIFLVALESSNDQLGSNVSIFWVVFFVQGTEGTNIPDTLNSFECEQSFSSNDKNISFSSILLGMQLLNLLPAWLLNLAHGNWGSCDLYFCSKCVCISV